MVETAEEEEEEERVHPEHLDQREMEAATEPRVPNSVASALAAPPEASECPPKRTYSWSN